MSGHHRCACGCQESDHATDFDCCTPGCPCKGFARRDFVPCSYCGTFVDEARREAVDGRYHAEGQCLEYTAAALGSYKRESATLRADLAQASSLLREAEARLVGAVAAERERCALECDAEAQAWRDSGAFADNGMADHAAQQCAARIRRGETT